MPLDNTSTNTTGYRYVSDLMLDVGVRLGTRYGVYSSGVLPDSSGYYNTIPAKLAGTWSQFSTQTHLNSVHYSLDHDSPVIAGAKSNQTGGGRHTWVIDGYEESNHIITNSYQWYPENMIPSGTPVYGYKSTSELLAQYNNMIYPGMPEIETFVTPISLLHMNWGLDGLYDGDFNANIGNQYTSWIGFDSERVVEYSLTPSELVIN